jgi:hypothetical protein|eukprot:COSAG01_NODE_6584_length_3593_cov_16.318260_2_plen_52_part_00
MEEEREAYTEALSAIQQHSSAAAVPSAAGLGPLAAEVGPQSLISDGSHAQA